MSRALEKLESVYANEMQRHRVGLGARRELLVKESTDERLRSEVMTDLAALHRAAAKVARSAADKEGGPGWLARAGHDERWPNEHLWTAHVAPLVEVTWSEVAPYAATEWAP